MKKVLIISYFYPPCNLTAAGRVASWVKYLPEHGIYPSVITRSWTREIQSEIDVARTSGSHLHHKKDAKHEVYYIPYKANLRDRLLVKGKLRIFRKMLSLVEQVLQNFIISVIPYYPLYKQAKSLLKDEQYDAVIISGNPFQQFYFGYKLNKEFNIPWIADYRDDWTTTELDNKPSLLNRIIKKLETYSEKKWVSTAACITSVSPHYANKISKFTGIKGYALYNGYNDAFKPNNNTISISNHKEMRMLYNGTLYASQDITVFAEGFNKACQKLNDIGINLIMQFPGLAYKPDQAKRVELAFQRCEKHIQITPRIPREKILRMQSEAHVLVMFSHKNIRGIPSSKMYEYLAFRKPILLSPGDDDILEVMINESQSGIVCRSMNAVFNAILSLKEDYESKQISNKFVFDYQQFANSKQGEKLAKLIKSISHETI